MNRLIRSALTSGLLIFAVCGFCMYFSIAWPLLYFIIFVPGLSYGVILVSNSGRSSSSKIMVVVSTVLYCLCFFMLNISDASLWFIARLLGVSVFGAVTLFCSYYLLVNREYNFIKTLLSSISIGFLSALPACLSGYYCLSDDNRVFYIGIFSIFPIWQVAFAWLITKYNIKNTSYERS